MRVIYYWIINEDQILLLTIYSKSERASLSAAELKAISDRIKGLGG